jgi:hypothetical protein
MLQGGPRVLRTVDGHAVDRQKVVSGRDADPRLAQGSAAVRVPGGPLEELRDPILAVVEHEAGAEHAEKRLEWQRY